MLGELIVAAKSAVNRCLYAAGYFIKKLIRPAPETVVAGVVQDVVSSRRELVVENALLRQQLIVARRSVSRPALRGGDRMLLVP